MSEEIFLILKRYAKIILWVFIIIVFARLVLVQPFFVSGPSMEREFFDKDLVFAEKASYYLSAPKRFDIVLLKSPFSFAPNETIIKRIVGLPNERVKIEKGFLFIFNDTYPGGIQLVGPRWSLPIDPEGLDVQLGSNEYFVMGDNNAVSLDSRAGGPIPAANISGRVFLRMLPLQSAGFFGKS